MPGTGGNLVRRATMFAIVERQLTKPAEGAVTPASRIALAAKLVAESGRCERLTERRRKKRKVSARGCIEDHAELG